MALSGFLRRPRHAALGSGAGWRGNAPAHAGPLRHAGELGPSRGLDFNATCRQAARSRCPGAVATAGGAALVANKGCEASAQFDRARNETKATQDWSVQPLGFEALHSLSFALRQNLHEWEKSQSVGASSRIHEIFHRQSPVLLPERLQN